MIPLIRQVGLKPPPWHRARVLPIFNGFHRTALLRYQTASLKWRRMNSSSLTQRYAELRKADSRIEDAWVELKVFMGFASATAPSPPGLDQNFDGRY